MKPVRGRTAEEADDQAADGLGAVEAGTAAVVAAAEGGIRSARSELSGVDEREAWV